MQFPCEGIVRDILPAFKAFIVKELFNSYKFTQANIAKTLGITQASVSYYLRGERGNTVSELMNKYPLIKEKLLSLTEAIAKNEIDTDTIIQDLCTLCSSMHEEFGCRGFREKKP
ncbi:MAG: transcriptional regulator [Candidatus Helarchaeota archaeon]